MSALLWSALCVLVGFVLAAISDMVSEEARDRLDHLPHAILQVAARQLHSYQRTSVYDDEWLPELTYILKGDEARPITRLYHGMRYAFGILVSAHRVASLSQRTNSVAEKASSDFFVLQEGVGDGTFTLSGIKGLGVGDTVTTNRRTFDVIRRLNDHEWLVRESELLWDLRIVRNPI